MSFLAELIHLGSIIAIVWTGVISLFVTYLLMVLSRKITPHERSVYFGYHIAYHEQSKKSFHEKSCDCMECEYMEEWYNLDLLDRLRIKLHI